MSRYGSWCSECVHNGCCEGLHYCGGRYFTSAIVECAKCGHSYNGMEVEMIELENGDRLCPDCAEEEGIYLEENHRIVES